jgi:hypothetical protein
MIHRATEHFSAATNLNATMEELQEVVFYDPLNDQTLLCGIESRCNNGETVRGGVF